MQFAPKDYQDAVSAVFTNKYWFTRRCIDGARWLFKRMFVVVRIEFEMSFFLLIFCVPSTAATIHASNYGEKKKKNPHSIPENPELSRFQRVSPPDPAMVMVDDVRGALGFAKATEGRSSS